MNEIEENYSQFLHTKIINLLKKRKITQFYPPQWEAIKPGLEGNNLVVSIPTASGKTLIAEIIALQKFLKASEESKNEPKKRKKILYLCPLKALANEKHKEFKKSWGDLGIRVGISTSDVDQSDFRVFFNDLIILTNEKADSLIRLNPKLIENIQMVICDEIHLINDDSRGITLEFLLTRLMTLNPNIQIVGLSATIKNANELAEWLKAKLITSDWRPVKLKEGFYLKNKIEFKDGSIRKVPYLPKMDDVSNLTIEMVKEGGQVLVFCNSRRSAVSVAESLPNKIKLASKPEDLPLYKKLQEDFKKEAEDSLEVSKKIYKCLRGGVAFHHAGLSRSQLDFIVKNFNNHAIKVICCTPTLAAGVNTPARRVIIKTLYRYTSDKGSVLIPIMEYKQMAGRAGRPQFDPYGEVVILGSNPDKLTENAITYINGESEDIYSKLSDEDRLQSHILSLIVSKNANTKDLIINFLKNTFYYYQLKHGTYILDEDSEYSFRFPNNTFKRRTKKKKIAANFGKRKDPLNIDNSENSFISAQDYLKSHKTHEKPKSSEEENTFKAEKELNTRIQKIITFFLEKDLIITQKNEKNVFVPTKFGKITSQSYVSPKDAVLIREDIIYALVLLQNKELELNTISWLHLITKPSGFHKLFLRKSDYTPINSFIEDFADNLIMEEIYTYGQKDYSDFAQEIKLTMILRDWISEIPEPDIVEHFNIGSGDLRRIINNAQWFLRTAAQISRLDADASVTKEFSDINLRVSHGIKHSLIPLVKLKGIGRIRARKLYNSGYTTIKLIKSAPLEKLAVVPLIGEKLARSIHEQILNPNAKPKSIIKRTPKKKIIKKKTNENEEDDSNQNPKKSLDKFL
ncbi:DEAD/DEAH box helicase [Promethearchaeum syntrophicum]|uniref:ATP-dependent DNA helicase Hel308 n=1 Tax=Promethearchaeum syntrophicum TaxID=2594042 RepID=A0A5B9DAM7_9ARCH|nr:DEAD/DEAH box helicase [Candidatus Prometheoarchaeum syntrophicum]QEE16152.1 Putative ski2-type helicase [Candidatus Prometheoarchaeum syntrophicum]